ncbi:uncharacterized protein E0L32_007883 [Thyridium curvatum]|uniref:Fanconi-associated nuclease n=1 Tax=Thyridium curvatum TaxID=1093900 RepID=A0A507AYD3_9PEZI|nr:uncharacterized protein E0L32_007883 [Thyridium curvatum]TPX11464.1 hypothetical protein E0L32_007883 [Thyridium curvatum]
MEGRPHKRLKTEDGIQSPRTEESAPSSGDEGDFKAADGRPVRSKRNDPEKFASGDDSMLSLGGDDEHQTAFETSLPPVRTDKEAIEEYEMMRASQASATEDDDASRLDSRKWVRGKSSIYVDAFNLALDTVLEDEAHLFDEKEKRVFEEWRALDYEAQYLYVRLFLRKTSAWHRSEKLGYYSDISSPEEAIFSLQKRRELPDTVSDVESSEDTLAGVSLQDWHLGDSFTFADSSEDHITTVEEAVSLLSLDELKVVAKDARVQGKNKAELQRALVKMSSQQAGLLSLGLRRSSTVDSTNSRGTRDEGDTPEPTTGQDSNRRFHFLQKIIAITGPCIRISPSVFKLFERVHLVFYRSTEWTEKSLTTIILAKISRRNFPEYIVCRSSNIFLSRKHLLDFEQAMRMEFEVDQILEFNGPPGEAGFRRILEIFDSLASRWRALLREEERKERQVYEFNEGGYLRRFNAAHSYTRIAHKAAYVLGRLHEYQREHALLSELLDQRLFQMARRGSWYQRKALLEEHYMYDADPSPGYADPEQQKKHWRRIAVRTCEQALEDRDCHLIYHYDLQRRLVKLERRLRIPRRLQHDFGHVTLRKPEEHTVEGIQIKREDEPAAAAAAGKLGRGPSTKTVWVDEAEGGGECSVEAMCLSHYRGRGWKGYHAEGGIIRTLFALLFYDVLFVYVPNVFQTAYQTCPLDLRTDAFYPTRASEANRRLVEISNGAAPDIVRRVYAEHCERRTCVAGLSWDFELEDLAELAGAFRGEALAAVCKVMAQEYGQRGGGIPDLVLWRTTLEDGDGVGEGDEQHQSSSSSSSSSSSRGQCMFAEVKSANDRLSDTQRLWIHVLTGAGVRVALCNAVAKEVRVLD